MGIRNVLRFRPPLTSDDWKPDPDDPILLFNREKQQHRKALLDTLTPNGMVLPATIYRGVLSIIELAWTPPRFIVIKDKDKQKLRFPFGQLEAGDRTPSVGAERETLEEVGIQVHFEEQDFVGEINFGQCIFYIFHKIVPSSVLVSLGEEQEQWGPPTATAVDRYVSSGAMAQKHGQAWKFFRQKTAT